MLSEKPWKAEAVLRLLLGLFASVCLGVFIVGLLDRFAPLHEVDKKFLRMIVLTISLQGAAFFWICVFLRETNLSWSEAFGFHKSRFNRALLWGAVTAVAVLPATWSLQMLSAHALQMVQVEPTLQPTVQELHRVGVPFAQQAYLFVIAVIAAPVAEELLFRGVLYPSIKQAGYPRLAFWGTALVFATIHANALSFISLLFLAVILTVLYEETDNLLAPIITHALFNGINFAFIMFQEPLRRLFSPP